MRLFLKIRNGLVKLLEIVLVALFAMLVLDVLWGVFSRYALGEQSRWTEELATYTLVWISLLGAALVYEAKGHLGVDYVVRKWDEGAQRLGKIFVELCVIAFATLILVRGGWQLVMENLNTNQVSPALGWRIGYLYSAVPISGVFFLIFSLEHLAKLFVREDSDES